MPEFLRIPYARSGGGLLWLLCSALIAGCAQGGAGSVPGSSRDWRLRIERGAVARGLWSELSGTLSRTARPSITSKAIPDGSRPEAPLFDLNGKLYGTTALGGSGLHRNVVYTITGSSESVRPQFHRITGRLESVRRIDRRRRRALWHNHPRRCARGRSGIQDH